MATTVKSKSTAATQKTAENTDVAQKIDPGICCYIGPTIIGVIQQSTIYAGDLKSVLSSAPVKLALAKVPEIKPLIVTGNELAAARQKIKIKGEPLYQAYRALIHRNKE